MDRLSTVLGLLQGFLPVAEFSTSIDKWDIFPAVIKMDSTEHKMEKDGVKIVCNREELEKYAKLWERYIVQSFIRGVEVFVGGKETEYGKVVLAGWGGSYVEKIGDVVVHPAPLTEDEARYLLKRTLVGRVVDNDCIFRVISRFSEWFAGSEYVEADLNPVIVNKEGCFIVDARLIPRA